MYTGNVNISNYGNDRTFYSLPYDMVTNRNVPIKQKRINIKATSVPSIINEQQSDEKYDCFCGRRYSLIRNLKYHQKWECGRILKCTKCGKTFKDLAYYRIHCKRCVYF